MAPGGAPPSVITQDVTPAPAASSSDTTVAVDEGDTVQISYVVYIPSDAQAGAAGDVVDTAVRWRCGLNTHQVEHTSG